MKLLLNSRFPSQVEDCVTPRIWLQRRQESEEQDTEWERAGLSYTLGYLAAGNGECTNKSQASTS